MARTPLPLLALLAVIGAGSGAAVQEPGPRPDLDVTYISLTPRYPAYEVEYPDGLPQEIDPETGKPLSAEESEKLQRWPRNGETVTATARVVNHGAAPAGPFRYTWLLDGKRAAVGRHEGLPSACLALPETEAWELKGRAYRLARLQPGSYVDLSHPFSWKRRGQTLELRLQPEDASAPEISTSNNARREQTTAAAFAVLIDRSSYNAWARQRGPLESFSFEDWIQRQLELVRATFEQSIYPSAPRGAAQALRIDTIRVLDDAEDPGTFAPLRALNGWDGYLLYAHDRRPDADTAAVEPVILPDVLRQLGIADLSVLEVEPPAGVTDAGLVPAYVRSTLDGTRAPNERTLPEHTVGALNRMEGQRRGYYGVYLYDIPRSCRVRVLDNNGRAIAEAAVRACQKDGSGIRMEPVAAGRADSRGIFPLPNRPAPEVQTPLGFALRPNPYGALVATGENGLLLLRVEARGHTDYAWLPVARLNLDYWSGQTSATTIDLRTRLPSEGAPEPPSNVSARQQPVGGAARVTVGWQAAGAGDVAGYFVYRARHPAYRFERVGAVTRLRDRFTDAPGVPDGAVFYAVTAVDTDGNESGLSAPVRVAP